MSDNNYIFTHFSACKYVYSLFSILFLFRCSIILIFILSFSILFYLFFSALVRSGLIAIIISLTNKGILNLVTVSRGEHCGGCRRSNSTERPHAFQVILAERPPLELSANNEQDMADWMQLLCQSVSKGVRSLSCYISLPKVFVVPFRLLVHNISVDGF